MGGLFNPSPGVEYSDDEIVAKINAAVAKITRLDAVESSAIDLSGKSADDIAEGTINKYDTGAPPLTTDDLLEGDISKYDTGVPPATQDELPDGITAKQFLAIEKTKLATVAEGAQVNPPDLATLDPTADTKLTTVDTKLTEEVTPAISSLDLRLTAYETEVPPVGLIELVSQVANGLDDVSIRMSPPVFEPGAGYKNSCGYINSKNWGDGCAMRFIVNIPQGVKVYKAYLMLWPAGLNSTRVVRSELGVENTLNATRITSLADFLSRPRLVTLWDDIEPFTSPGTWHNSPSLKSHIQYLISNPSWVSGNAIQVFWDDRLDRSDHTQEWTMRMAAYYESVGGSGWAPKFYIAYTLP